MEESKKYKERITTSIDPDLLCQVRHLASKQRCPLNKLFEEAIQDLLKKYEKKVKK